MRSPLFMSALLSLSFAAACDDAADERRKAITAQNQANEKIAEVSKEADEKARKAQDDANKKVTDVANDANEKMQKTQIEAANKVADVQNAADKKVNELQADADKKTAAAQADFLKMREDFRHKVNTDLVELDKKIADLKANAKKATGKAKANLDAKSARVQSARDTFANDYKSIETETARTWDDAKARLEKEWTALKASIDKD